MTQNTNIGAGTGVNGVLDTPRVYFGKQSQVMNYLGASLGLLLLFAGGAMAQPPVLDHLACYPTPGQPTVAQWAQLSDQFDVRDKVADIVNDIRMVEFCNPAQKTVIYGSGFTTVPVVHPDAHLAMYLTTPQGNSIPRAVTINNQFGQQHLITYQAEILGVPSGEARLSPNGGAALPAIPPAAELDHFRCYAATGPSFGRMVALDDKFYTPVSEIAMVLTPQLFCNPVSKSVFPQKGCPAGQVCALDNFPILHPQAHLACYAISPRTPFDGVITYNNQFVKPGTIPTAELTTPNLLCVPSSKSEDWRDIGPNG